jgi:carboxypeptidase family protein
MSVLGILFAVVLSQQPQSASIEGTVVQWGSSQPVDKALVEVSGENGRDSSAVTTGADGRFEFRNLAPGNYRIKVSRNGYMGGAYGQRGPNGPGRVLSVNAGQAANDLRIAIVALGAITGRVYDGSGEPAANITVQALKYSYANGQRTLT